MDFIKNLIKHKTHALAHTSQLLNLFFSQSLLRIFARKTEVREQFTSSSSLSSSHSTQAHSHLLKTRNHLLMFIMIWLVSRLFIVYYDLKTLLWIFLIFVMNVFGLLLIFTWSSPGSPRGLRPVRLWDNAPRLVSAFQNLGQYAFRRTLCSPWTV